MSIDRSRQLPLVSRSRWTPELLAAVAEGESKVLVPLVKRGPDGAVEAARTAFERAAELFATAMQTEPPPAPIACRAGCSVCCQAKVLVLAPEVLRIADYVRRCSTEDACASLLERVRAVLEKTKGFSRAQRAEAHVPCPLLDEKGGCSVHEVRPLVCASWRSFDAGACERYWAEPSNGPAPPVYGVGYELNHAVLAGLGKACFDAGRDGAPLELVAALRIALERPNAGERWHRRLPVFQMARDAEWIEMNAPGTGR